MSFEAAATFRQVRFKLEAAGFKGIRQSANHAKFIKHEENGVVRTAVLPHYTELSPSVIASILRQSGLTKEQFDAL